MIPDLCSKPQVGGDHRPNLGLNAILTAQEMYTHIFGGSSISTVKHLFFHKVEHQGSGLTSTRECQCAMGFRG